MYQKPNLTRFQSEPFGDKTADYWLLPFFKGFPGGSDGEESAAM